MLLFNIVFVLARISDVDPVIVPGPTGAASNLETIEEFWDILFNDEIINIIVNHTNNQIEKVCLDIIQQDQDLQTYHHHTDSIEIRAFIGLLYYSGVWKQSNVDNHELWSKKQGITFYRCVMPRARFMFIASCLRFDDKGSRNKSDKFSPIREIWKIFIGNCTRYYKPHFHCTVDEQLLDFRGKCSFRMYIPSKPDKYGIKLITLNDARTSYLVNFFTDLHGF